MVEAKHKWKAWIYLTPTLILLAIFTVYPIFNTVLMAFREGYSPLGAQGGETFKFGFENFAEVVSYPQFKTCLKNTLLLCVLTVPISCILALLVAVGLNSIPKFSSLLQTIYFLPYVTNSIAIGMVFAMMFNIIGLQNMEKTVYDSMDDSLKNGLYWIETKEIPATIFSPAITTVSGKTAGSWGLINNLIMALGFDPVNWINVGSAKTGAGGELRASVANYAVMVIYIVWNALPFKIIILLGGLQSVNKQYYDAAKIDGAPRWRVFLRITVPLLSPMIAYVVITSFIAGFKEYTSIVGIYGENMGPAGAKGVLNTMVGYVYNALTEDSYGTASAAALILFGIILLVTLLNLYVSKKKVHY